MFSSRNSLHSILNFKKRVEQFFNWTVREFRNCKEFRNWRLKVQCHLTAKQPKEFAFHDFKPVTSNNYFIIYIYK